MKKTLRLVKKSELKLCDEPETIFIFAYIGFHVFSMIIMMGYVIFNYEGTDSTFFPVGWFVIFFALNIMIGFLSVIRRSTWWEEEE